MSLFKKEAPTPDPAAAPEPESGGMTLAIKPVAYEVVKNTLIHLEWARERNDYVYHWKTLKKSGLSEEQVLARLMTAVDDLLPKETHVYFDKPIPDPDLPFPFYTIRVSDIATRPGAQEVCEKKLVDLLSRLNVWT